jgi:spore germination protein
VQEETKKPLLRNLEGNLEYLKKIFKDCSDLVFREIMTDHQVSGLLVFVDGIVNSNEIHDNAIRPLLFQMVLQNVYSLNKA